MPGAPPAGHCPSVTGRFSRAAPPLSHAGDTLHGAWQRCPPPLADSRSPCCLSSFVYGAHAHRGRRLLLDMYERIAGCRCLYSSVAERQSCKLKVLGSIPSGGLSALLACAVQTLSAAGSRCYRALCGSVKGPPGHGCRSASHRGIPGGPRRGLLLSTLCSAPP